MKRIERSMLVFAAAGLLLGATAVHAVEIELGCAWLDSKRTEGGAMRLRDVDALGAANRADFVWNAASNQWQLTGNAAEPWAPVLARVDSIRDFDDETKVEVIKRRWRVFGRAVTGASVTTPGQENFTLAYSKLLGCTRRFQFVDASGAPAPGDHQFSVNIAGSVTTATVSVDEPLMPPLVVTQNTRVGNGLFLSVEEVTGHGKVEYLFRVFDVEIGEFVYEQFADVPFILTPDIALAPGERYRVYISAVTRNQRDDQAVSVYKGPITVW